MAVLCLTVFVSSAVPAFGADYVFGVRPGNTVESAYFGVNLGTLVPFVGIDFLSASVTVEDTDLSASMYVPNFGVRFYLSSSLTGGSVVPYVQAAFLKSFASVDVGDTDSEVTDAIADLLSFYGISVGFGAEYFFSDNFSVGGEYGLRYIKASAAMEVSLDILDEPIEIDSDLDIVYNASYANVSLNFHF